MYEHAASRKRPGLGSKLRSLKSMRSSVTAAVSTAAAAATKRAYCVAAANPAKPMQQQRMMSDDFHSLLMLTGMTVVKHHRNEKKGAAERTIAWDSRKHAMMWRSHKFGYLKTRRSVPLRDVLDIERHGRLLWVKTLHMGEFGFEVEHAAEAEVIFSALNALLDEFRGPARCPVGALRSASFFS
eukprot:TRINITY_DN442_c0_g1_i1.p1 TRINITY_DN442_c0_g1~~TRINITY_DN442_c0_g1_i1.p1  ORF type:complete len:184 (-),score=31.66 TRINITY_DN442_c0_g1_i1:287-838(-)